MLTYLTMRRIGIAASKMSKGGLVGYNLWVILIASLVSLFIFFICGFAILLILFLVSLFLHAFRPSEPHAGLLQIFKICLGVLALILGFFNGLAIFKNIQWPSKDKI